MAFTQFCKVDGYCKPMKFPLLSCSHYIFTCTR